MVDPYIDPITGSISSFDHSKFDDFEVQSSPLEHHELSVHSRNSVMDWLDLDFNITRDYNLINGGSASSDNFPVNILHGIPIEAQSQNVTVNGHNIEYNFFEWEDGNTSNPRIFYTSHDVTKTAKMKGHSVSNEARATGYNNGRRIIKTNGGGLDHYHMVYEDGEDIWYTYSLDNGQTWQPEEMISSGDGNCTNPSIAYCWGTYLAVWEEYDPGTTTTDICYSKRYLDGSTWTWTSPGSIEYGWGEARPVVTSSIFGSGAGFAIAWRLKDSPTSSYKIYVSNYPLSQGTPSSGIAVPGGSNNYPAIVGNQSDPRITLVWTESGQLCTCTRSSTGTWSSEKTLAVWPDFTNHNRPSASLNGTLCHVGFECEMMPMGPPMGGGTPTIGYGYFDINQSNPNFYFYIVEFNGSVEGNPTLGKGSDVSIFYEKNGNIYCRSKSGFNWIETSYSDGNYPNIAHDSQNGAVWTKYASAPYFIKTDLSGGLSKMSALADASVLEESKRFYYPLAARTEDSFDRYIVQLNGMYVNGKLYHFDDQLQSEPLKMKKENEIELLWSVFSDYVPENMILMCLYFKTEKDKHLLDTIASDELWPAQKEDVRNVSKKLTYSINENMAGTVLIEFDNNEPYVVTLLNDETKSSLAKDHIAIEQVAEVIPEEFGLGQNFPNPFNPTTQISFDLPQASEISLKVFDINGREIANLIEGYKEAGRHQVLFDGSSLSSGVYIYRLRAGNFNSVKRMLLMK